MAPEVGSYFTLSKVRTDKTYFSSNFPEMYLLRKHLAEIMIFYFEGYIFSFLACRDLSSFVESC